MKITNEYVEFVTTTGVKTRIYKKDNPSLYFSMSINTDDGVPFGVNQKSIQEDYTVWQEDY